MVNSAQYGVIILRGVYEIRFQVPSESFRSSISPESPISIFLGFNAKPYPGEYHHWPLGNGGGGIANSNINLVPLTLYRFPHVSSSFDYKVNRDVALVLRVNH